ncbi:TMV resistance protein N-like isoform X1 [Quercus lobata]|uniref:TMV resistance protein N-like isoform X1 n=1 Tax=Quercus lobata TaxID=97700 RepID=UPI00124417F5|nr:TMV resistance protein N-like isoform X1 [Quercus lobata]XP_030934346.1 TMV resistance protein N-like isoform X1 [Quercus lobata]XP_030934347.1 TMV resistance protein N-like isoform X1 [Quercus lobata]XP_030934348.1 TMV resistance protein N-like isoform X1 [Quercus lobata]
MSAQGALPSSSSSKSGWKYEVFLSFRGEDTRKSFADHLFHALEKKGIVTFRDNEKLERGKSISEELLKAIEESRLAIIIFSENYASSRWCLDELVHIVKCKNEIGLEVGPVFYHVNPSDVRHQKGTFAQAFDKHKESFKESIEKVETWRDALREVAGIAGWDLQDRHESEFIQHIMKDIMKKLSPEFSSFTENLVGIDSIMEKLIPLYLGLGNRVYMLGIWGMGGLGKTTLARAIYHRYSKSFEGSSFIQSVRERSKPSLLEIQQQLLENILGSHEKIWDVYEGVEIIKRRLRQKKVLLVLDDIDHVDQLEKLAGKHDWFGLGSWIIITTRDERVFVNHEGLQIYKPDGLDGDDASKLFCLKAFKQEQPKEGYMQLSRNVVKYASGLPLALVTLGSFLARRTVEEWQSALDSFKNIKGDIHDILEISYHGLEEMWKNIFLDIACFFRGWRKDQVIEILETCGFNAKIGISVLVEKSLLTIDDNKCLGMHDLLAEMGQKNIFLKLGGNLGKQSRLWLVKDLLHVLENNMATEEIQAIVVEGWKEDFSLEEISEGFSKMSKLRLLIIDGMIIDGMNSLNDQRHLALPNNLRYLQWNFCPFKCLASSHKRMAFVQLVLQCSKLEYLWEGVMRSNNLKFIDLSFSKNLIRTPDFSGVPILEELNLSNCGQLVEIHPSIGQLKKLRYLCLFWCASLTNLPTMSAAMMQSLMVLDLSRCYKISSFPKFTGIMKSLSRLNLAWTAIEKVEPSSIECLTALAFLDLSHCTRLEYLPSNMDNLKSLEIVKFSQCSKLKSLPRLPSNVRPRLPSNVRHIEAEGFSFLNWSPEGVKLSIWSQPLSQWLPFDESGSLVGFTKLFHFLRVVMMMYI